MPVSREQEIVAHELTVGGISREHTITMRVLIIEDDQRLAKLISRVLEGEHFTVDLAFDGNKGIDMALTGVYDVAVVDWMLPGRDGPSICRGIRAARLPLAMLMLTARGQIEDRVLGLDSGADDYLGKPFAFEELLARVRALGRRFAPVTGDASELRYGDIVMDIRSHTARRANRSLDLTSTEWNLLEFMMRHPGQTLTRQQILDYVWSYESEVQVKMVDVYISYLRAKLRVAGDEDPIKTVRNVGYRFVAPDV
jgi:two-component system OmpR family response regulator